MVANTPLRHLPGTKALKHHIALRGKLSEHALCPQASKDPA